MGGTSKQTQDVSQTTSQAPYAPAIPLVSGVANAATGLLPNLSQLTPEQQQAFAGLTANAQAGNPYAGAIGDYAGNLLGGGGAQAQAPGLSNALSTYQNQLSPYAGGSQIGANNPYVNNLISTLGTDIAAISTRDTLPLVAISQDSTRRISRADYRKVWRRPC